MVLTHDHRLEVTHDLVLRFDVIPRQPPQVAIHGTTVHRVQHDQLGRLVVRGGSGQLVLEEVVHLLQALRQERRRWHSTRRGLDKHCHRVLVMHEVASLNLDMPLSALWHTTLEKTEATCRDLPGLERTSDQHLSHGALSQH